MHRSIPALVIAVALLTTMSACGSSDDAKVPTMAEYRATYKTLNKEFAALRTSIGTAFNTASGKSNSDLQKTFQQLAEQTRKTAKRFDETTPPDNPRITSIQAALVKGLNVAADDLEAISKARGKGDQKAVDAVTAKLAQDDVAVATPHQDLDAAVLGTKPAAAQDDTTTKG